MVKKIIVRWLTGYLLLITNGLLAQPSLQGVVVSGDNGEPLPSANVFLANTTKGTVTDNSGKFRITQLPPGRFDLVVSYVGFETLVIPIHTDSLKYYRILLTPSANQLAEVKIKARRDPDWEQNLAFFRKNFIGQSVNAARCRLLNPEVLWFDDDRANLRLTAGAREPLLIENQALGYRLKYQLESFVFDSRQKAVTYLGYPVLEAMVPRNARQQNRWLANRRKAYLGSTMHFMRALHRRSLAEDGFLVQRIVEKPDTVRSKPQTVRYLIRDTLRYAGLLNLEVSTATQTRLQMDGLFQVTYQHEKEDLAYLRMQRPFGPPPRAGGAQTSVVHMLNPFVDIEANGNFYEPLGILVEGYWSWEKIAELLPLDYELSP
ncbi:carboxypeptidase-like regulatory domain-containing protein [Larkinella insperata]|uniref:Carboxypeptidase-like regulatory domain-containing protein n=1 Tax=Larkinella insperata TaxID=332158 RepID=A0ABW3Q5H9_9BACT|nr:carboxypeptidase-like regulatory domain-containing protein [Larkinella insperata]